MISTTNSYTWYRWECDSRRAKLKNRHLHGASMRFGLLSHPKVKPTSLYTFGPIHTNLHCFAPSYEYVVGHSPSPDGTAICTIQIAGLVRSVRSHARYS